MDFIYLAILIAAAAVIYFVYLLIKDKKISNNQKRTNIQATNFPIIQPDIPQQINEPKKLDLFPYHRKNLLTKNEWFFFKKLKEITDRHNLHILSKVRLIDLVDVNEQVPQKEKLSYRARIIQKHVDFVLVNPDTFQVYMIIELDDSSHNAEKRKERDDLVNKVCEAAKIPIIHAWGIDGLEKTILQVMSSLI